MNLPNYFKVSTPNNTDINLEPIFNDDVVEVIRCKDCKHNIINHGRYCTYGDCLGCLVADDFFCKNGERKETE